MWKIYNRETAMKLSAAAILLFVACAASQSAPVKPWRVEVTTSGGITGRGNGGWGIDSEGKISVTAMNRRTCTYDATPEELRRFETLLANARPETWKDSYVPEDNCCDRIEYRMTVVRGDQERKIVWIDDPMPMPKDLDAIAKAVTGVAPSLRTEYGPQCI
ncbi:MAG TPA: hypothetical protein VEQ65_12890 [Opitutus sp.]|nr:hypothetical protein [Opitutus sp.]